MLAFFVKFEITFLRIKMAYVRNCICIYFVEQIKINIYDNSFNVINYSNIVPGRSGMSFFLGLLFVTFEEKQIYYY